MQQGDQFLQAFVVSPEVYGGFISIFKDENPLHTDETFARSKGFEGKVMHGNILNGFLSYFVGECLPMKNVIIHSQTIKYSLPVYLGDRLDFSAKISGVFESVNAYEFKFQFTNDKKVKVASGTFQIGLLA